MERFQQGNENMNLGILADIHEDVDSLDAALARLQRERVDRIVVLGDLLETGRRAGEIVTRLRGHDAVGVYGNHDLGLCFEPTQEICEKFGGPVMEFFGTLRSHFNLGDILFCHGIPSLDATDPAAYYLGARPHEDGALDESFACFRHRLMFIGHFHRWYAATPGGGLSWDGESPLKLEPGQRYFVVVHAVMNGWFAVYDDDAGVLTPCRI